MAGLQVILRCSRQRFIALRSDERAGLGYLLFHHAMPSRRREENR